MPVYIDLIMLLNFLVDFLLLLGTNRLSGFPPDCGKTALAAAIGGVYAGVCILPGFRFLGNLLWRTVSLVLMGLAAFGWNRSALQKNAVFILLSMALGGIAAGSHRRDFSGQICCAGLLWLLCRFGFRGQVGSREYVPAELCWGERCVRLLALKDTGNTLRDPLTGEQVLVCGADVGEELLGLPRMAFANPADALAAGILPGLRLIPYHAVGRPSGMMLAIRLSPSKIGTEVRTPLVAFAPEEIARGEVYRMLTGGTI